MELLLTIFVLVVFATLFIAYLNKSSRPLGAPVVRPNEVRIWVGHAYAIHEHVVGKDGNPGLLYPHDPRPMNRSDDIFLGCAGGASGADLGRLTSQDRFNGPPLAASFGYSLFNWASQANTKGLNPHDDRNKPGQSQLESAREWLSGWYPETLWDGDGTSMASYYLAATILAARDRAREIGAARIRFILVDGHEEVTVKSQAEMIDGNGQMTGVLVRPHDLLQLE